MLASRRVNRRTESPRHYPDNDLVEVRRVVAWLPPVAGYAVAPLPLDDVTGASPIPAPSVMGDSDTLDNGILRVHLEVDRTISIAARDGSWSVVNALSIENVGDRGDLYTHSPFGPVRIEHRFLRSRLIHPGPLRAELETRWRIVVPSRADRRLAGARRDGHAGFIDVRVRFRLDAGSPFLRMVVDGVNGAAGHRLRAALAHGVVERAVWADAAFGPVRRVARGRVG